MLITLNDEEREERKNEPSRGLSDMIDLRSDEQ